MRKVSGAPEISPEKRLNQRQKSRVTKTGGIPVLCVSAGKCGGQHPGMLPGFSFDTGSVLIMIYAMVMSAMSPLSGCDAMPRP